MTPAPFEFRDCALITLSVGKTAQNLRELRDRLDEVPASSLWHHFVETLLRPQFDDPEYPNDVASWVKRALNDEVLAERLGVIDPVEYGRIEDLRQHLIELVEDRLSESTFSAQAHPAHTFHFLRAQTVVLSTETRAATPRELGSRIASLPTGSIYFHFVEARRRTADHSDDFSNWLAQWGDRTQPMRQRLAGARVHLGPLSELREKVAACFEGVEAWEASS